MSLFRGTFRLSLIAASLFASYAAFENYQHYTAQISDRENTVSALKCGAKFDPTKLESVKNEFGLFDIGKLGCADKQFWASQIEMQHAWSGKMGADWIEAAPRYDFIEVTIKFLLAFVLINFCGLLFWISMRLLSWVSKGFA
jgi:hypothetical protein